MASFESFLSLETRLEEGNTMRQQWNDNDIMQRETGDIDEPWMSAEFNQLTRRQQNCEIYRVYQSEWEMNRICEMFILAGCSFCCSIHEC